MLDVTKNGIYRFVYIVASNIGFWLYQAIESITNQIIKALKWKPAGLKHGVINLFLYIGSIFCLTYLYEYTMSYILGAGNTNFQFTETDSYSRLCNIFILLKVFQKFGPVDSIATFFTILWNTLESISFYIIGTILHFSVLYGLLAQKLLELHPIQLTGSKSLCALLDYGAEDSTSTNVLKQLLAAVLGFIDQVSLFINFKVLSVLLAFFLIFAGYSGVQVWRGDEANWKDLLFEIIDQTGIITILGSFLISFLVAKVVELVCLLINNLLPNSVQSRLKWLSEKGNQTVANIQEIRKTWARKHDCMYTWELRNEYVRKINLDDD